jgi:death-on-curing protein
VTEPIWLETREALVLHDRLLALDGGAPDVRDLGLLESAMARPRQHLAHGGGSSIVDLAAIYTTAIVRNHPFTDGNKRTGFVVGVLFLELNGLHFTASEEDAAQAVIALAASAWSEAEYAAFLAANTQLSRP